MKTFNETVVLVWFRRISDRCTVREMWEDRHRRLQTFDRKSRCARLHVNSATITKMITAPYDTRLHRIISYSTIRDFPDWNADLLDAFALLDGVTSWSVWARASVNGSLSPTARRLHLPTGLAGRMSRKARNPSRLRNQNWNFGLPRSIAREKKKYNLQISAASPLVTSR